MRLLLVTVLGILFGFSSTLLAAPNITQINLIDASTGETLISNLENGSSINLANISAEKITLQAITEPSIVRKVEFYTNSKLTYKDFAFPYAYQGDDGGNFNAWKPSLGIMTLEAIPFDRQTHKKGTEKLITLSIVDNVNPSLEPSSSPLASPSSILSASPSSFPSTSCFPSASPSNSSSIKPSISQSQAPQKYESESPIPSASASASSSAVAFQSASPSASSSASASPSASSSPLDLENLPIFPAAMGFGTTTTAGSGRGSHEQAPKVYSVRNLNQSGEGSLSECITASEPRTCIFEVSGNLNLEEPIKITNPYISILGQTAPTPGFGIRGAGIQVRSHDVLIQHMRIEVGDEKNGPSAGERDGIVCWGTKNSPVFNVVLDHLTVLWAIDENISTYGDVTNVTISNSIIAEGLHDSIHPKGPHSKGILVGENSTYISIHHNLLAHNQDRNPRLNPGSSTEFISNLVYNWGGRSGWNVANLSDTSKTGNPTFLNFIGNVFKAGKDSTNVKAVYASSPDTSSRVYVSDNLDPVRQHEFQDEWNTSSLPRRFQTSTPIPELSNIIPTTSVETETYVIQNAGARLKEFNNTDVRIKKEVLDSSGRIKDCISGCKYRVGLQTQLPKNIRPLTLPENPFSDDNKNGYTNLEDWVFEISESLE